MRNFSRGIKKAADLALKKTIERLIERIEKDTECEKEKNGKVIVHHGKDNEGNTDYSSPIARIELARKDDITYYLPILPIIYGGDDLTFVCDAVGSFFSRDIYLRF